MTTATLDADVCVVGAGILGLAHAHEARERGLRVAVLERGERAVGASVRNFGHIFVSGMGDGDALACALRARARWLELGRRAGLEVLESGTVIVGRSEDELEVMAGAAGDERRGLRLVTAAEALALAPIASAGVRGALYATLDLRVDPRLAVARLAALLEDDDGAEMVWGASVHDVEPGVVHSSSTRVRAPFVIVCPGPEYRTLAPYLMPEREGLTRCKLQMLRVRAPAGLRYRPALLTGLSLLRYPAFAEQPGLARVRARVSEERPEVIEGGVHLIVTQLSDGDLILGDTHEYGDTVSPFGDERLDELVLAEARSLLGAESLEVRERWHGTYPSAPGGPFLVNTPLEGVRVVEVVSGVGMTTALGLAPQVLDELLAGSGSGAGAPHASAAAT